MNKITRTVVQNRQIVIPASDDLPDGTPVKVQITNEAEKTCMDESDWDDTPEGIEEWIKAVNELEPLIFTDQELAQLEADRQAQKQWEKDHFAEHADKLAKEWE